MAYIGVITIPWEHAAEIVTFGALTGLHGGESGGVAPFLVFGGSALGIEIFSWMRLCRASALFFVLLLMSLQTWTKYAGLGLACGRNFLRRLQNARLYPATETHRFQRIVEPAPALVAPARQCREPTKFAYSLSASFLLELGRAIDSTQNRRIRECEARVAIS